MRKDEMFNYIIDSVEDDLSQYITPDGSYALCLEDGAYMFQIIDNDDGHIRIGSDPIFPNDESIRKYLLRWYNDSDIEII